MEREAAPSVLLADEQLMFLQGLKIYLEREGIDVVGMVFNGLDVVAEVKKKKPDLVILEVILPGLNGIDAAHEVQRASPDTRVILMSWREDSHLVLRGIRAGIRAYIFKTEPLPHLLNALKLVTKGSFYLSPSAVEAVISARRNEAATPLDVLTLEERKVLQLIAEGHSIYSAARVLDIYLKKARKLRKRIIQKLQISSTAGLVRFAFRTGIANIHRNPGNLHPAGTQDDGECLGLGVH